MAAGLPDIIMLVGESEQNRVSILMLLMGVSTKRLTDRPRSDMLMTAALSGRAAAASEVGTVGWSVGRPRVCFPVQWRPPCRGACCTAARGRPVLSWRAGPAGHLVGGTFTVTQHL